MSGPVIPDSVTHAVAEAIGDALDCTRTWSAWRHGSMGPADFYPVAEDADRVAEIARAAITAWEDSKPQADPVAWVSPEQLTAHKDRLAGEGGDYLPARLTRDGLFTQPLYAAPQPPPVIDLEQFRDAVEVSAAIARLAGEDAVGSKMTRLLALIDGQAGGQNHPDTDRLDFIEGECLALEAVSVRASEDDADVAWVVSQHQMQHGKVVLHRSHDDNLRRAIDAVMQPTKGEGE